MSSVGFTNGRGAGVVPALQRAWTDAVENDLRVMDTRQEILSNVVAGIAEALRWPLRIACGIGALASVSLAILAGLRIAEALR